jgi:hypothetical protein
LDPDRQRAITVANGASASGFVKTLNESHKQGHANKAKMWRDHCDSLHQRSGGGMRMARSLFFDFDDPRFDTVSPSVNFLLPLVTQETESNVTREKGLLETTTLNKSLSFHLLKRPMQMLMSR